MTTNLLEEITAEVAALPYNKQREVLALVKSWAVQNSTASRTHNLKGITADGAPSISRAEFDAARREMWGDYVEDGAE